MAPVALTHRTSRCSQLLAPFHNTTTDRATRSQRFMDTQVSAAAHGASHTTCLVFAESTVAKLLTFFENFGSGGDALKKDQKRMISIITEIVLRIVAKHKHSCVTFTLQVSHSCVNSHNSLPRPPQLLKGHRRRTAGWGNGWQPKSPHNSIWQGKPACWGRPGVQPQLPGLP